MFCLLHIHSATGLHKLRNPFPKAILLETVARKRIFNGWLFLKKMFTNTLPLVNPLSIINIIISNNHDKNKIQTILAWEKKNFKNSSKTSLLKQQRQGQGSFFFFSRTKYNPLFFRQTFITSCAVNCIWYIKNMFNTALAVFLSPRTKESHSLPCTHFAVLERNGWVKRSLLFTLPFFGLRIKPVAIITKVWSIIVIFRYADFIAIRVNFISLCIF